MRTTIISIGNSKGIRIPKVLLEESGLKKQVELQVKKGEIKIIPIVKKTQVVHSWARAAESTFAKDWLRPEEDEAWESYQSDK